jgi:hypothetical protein
MQGRYDGAMSEDCKQSFREQYEFWDALIQEKNQPDNALINRVAAIDFQAKNAAFSATSRAIHCYPTFLRGNPDNAGQRTLIKNIRRKRLQTDASEKPPVIQGLAVIINGAVRGRMLCPVIQHKEKVISTTTTNPIAITDFVRRQTPESRFGHYEGDIEELMLLDDFVIVKDEPDLRIVSMVDTSKFRSSVVAISSITQQLKAVISARQEGEDCLVNVTVTGEKGPARYVELILYSRAALAKEGIEIDRDWGLVSINCSPGFEPTPMRPETMARNMLGMKGGTQREYTAKEFADAVWFWSRHVMVESA